MELNGFGFETNDLILPRPARQINLTNHKVRVELIYFWLRTPNRAFNSTHSLSTYFHSEMSNCYQIGGVIQSEK